jgi:hypothetical protein
VSFNFRSLIAERQENKKPDDNESFDVQRTFKKILKEKAEKTNDMIA